MKHKDESISFEKNKISGKHVYQGGGRAASFWLPDFLPVCWATQKSGEKTRTFSVHKQDVSHAEKFSRELYSQYSKASEWISYSFGIVRKIFDTSSYKEF